MSTAILPDDSVVVRMPTHTVHIDAMARAIHVREPSAASELGGIIRASFPLEAAERIRLMRARTGKQHLCLDLASGETLDLGEVPSPEVAMVTARAIAELTRCKIEVAQGQVAQLPGNRPAPVPPARPSPPAASSWPAESAEETFEVCEALIDSQDGVPRPRKLVEVETRPPEPAVPGDVRTVEMTKDEAARAIARARARSLAPKDGAGPVMPSDLDESDGDEPTVTPENPLYTGGLDSTDRDRPIDDIFGADGLAQTVADRALPAELLAEVRAAKVLVEDLELDSQDDESGLSTQPDQPLPEELGRTGKTEADSPFNEETELAEEPVPIFQQLLPESQLAAARSPGGGGSDGQTDLQVTARPHLTRIDALVEILRATVESLPEASPWMPEDDV